MGLWSQIQRWRYNERDFPDSWRAILQEHYPAYSTLSGEDRVAFESHLKHFVWTKNWEGARGLEVTDEMKVLIAAAAARIARRLPFDVYDNLESVVVYPRTFSHEQGAATLGLAHRWGTVVLSWDSVTHGIAIPDDAQDTAIHEFAHVLDFENGTANGTPLLEDGRHYDAWVRVMSTYFEQLRDGGSISSVMDDYGATNEAEFFAVATEAFFERPLALKKVAPELYVELSVFYRVDPIEDQG